MHISVIIGNMIISTVKFLTEIILKALIIILKIILMGPLLIKPMWYH